MKSRDLVFPALVFLGGAVVGRVIGLKPLMRGAMTLATVAGFEPAALLKTAVTASSRRKSVPAARAARKKPIQKKSRAA